MNTLACIACYLPPAILIVPITALAMRATMEWMFEPSKPSRRNRKIRR
jgi:hypothetical protein